MGSCGYFCEWANEIKTRKFVPQQRLAHITHTMIHPSLSQVLIRQGWEASLPDVELNKSMQVGARVDPAYPKADNT